MNLYKIFGANDIKLAVNSLLIVLLLIVEKKSICYNLLIIKSRIMFNIIWEFIINLLESICCNLQCKNKRQYHY